MYKRADGVVAIVELISIEHECTSILRNKKVAVGVKRLKKFREDICGKAIVYGARLDVKFIDLFEYASRLYANILPQAIEWQEHAANQQ